jgi:tetratricopeptide (TPR) repeat protein
MRAHRRHTLASSAKPVKPVLSCLPALAMTIIDRMQPNSWRARRAAPLASLLAATALSLVGAGCGSPRDAAESAHKRGLELEAKGDTAGAGEAYRSAVEGAAKAGTPLVAARSHARLGAMAMAKGDLPGALAQFEAGVTAAREAGEGDDLGNLLNNVGLVKKSMGDLEGAESNYLEAVAETHRTKNLLG